MIRHVFKTDNDKLNGSDICTYYFPFLFFINLAQLTQQRFGAYLEKYREYHLKVDRVLQEVTSNGTRRNLPNNQPFITIWEFQAQRLNMPAPRVYNVLLKGLRAALKPARQITSLMRNLYSTTCPELLLLMDVVSAIHFIKIHSPYFFALYM